MLLLRALFLELKTNKNCKALLLLLILLLVGLTLIIYGIVLFSTEGVIDHGDHNHLRARFQLTLEEIIVFVVGSIILFFTLASFCVSCFMLMRSPKQKQLEVDHANKTNLKPKAIVNCDLFQLGDHCVFTFKKLSFKQRFKQDFFARSKFSFRSELYRLCLVGVSIALNLALSLIEIPGIVLPWGSSIQFRFFNTAILFIAVRFVGLLSTSLVALITPWLHLLIHPIHTPISSLFYMVNDFLVLWIFYFFYFHLFKAEVIQTTTVVDNKPFSQLVNTKKTKWTKFFSLLVISFLCGFIEGLGFYFGYFLILGNVSSLGLKIYYDGLQQRDLINSSNVLFFLMTTTAIFSIKYIFEMLFFFSVEKNVVNIANHFGLY